MAVVVNLENLNAFKLNLALLHVAKSAAQYKLQQEIINTNAIFNTTPSTSKDSATVDDKRVSEFLKKTYNSFMNQYPNKNDLPSYLQGLVKTLNPEYPNERPQDMPFPNDLKSFDISSCYQLAFEVIKNKHGVLNKTAAIDLKDFFELRSIRNEFYAQLRFFKIEDKIYMEQIEKLEKIIETFRANDLKFQIFRIDIISLYDSNSKSYLQKYIECIFKLLDEKKITIESIVAFKSKGDYLDQIDHLENEVSKCLIENQIDLKQFLDEHIKSKTNLSNYFNFDFNIHKYYNN